MLRKSFLIIGIVLVVLGFFFFLLASTTNYDQSKNQYGNWIIGSNWNIGSNWVVESNTLPPPFPIDMIINIIEETVQGIFTPVGSTLIFLASTILILIRRARNNRPKDYNGMKQRK